MIITRIETIELAPPDPTDPFKARPYIWTWVRPEPHHGSLVQRTPLKWTWVRLHTDEGLIGLGETYSRTGGESSVIHRGLAPLFLGQDAREIDRLWAELFEKVRIYGWAGAEMRALSAIDIALWDLLGKHVSTPIYQLLGGATRKRIPVYNTCYDHEYDFGSEGDKLAQDLLEMGIQAMKIWPFDVAAREASGTTIKEPELRRCLRPVERIRQAVGNDIDIAIELHGLWDLPSAIKIAKSLEPFDVMWLEDPMPQDHLDAYVTLSQKTSIPLCLGERLMTRYQFRELLAKGCAQVVMLDVEWTGGISEAKRIASMAEAYLLPVAPHNCGGPVLHQISAHLAANIPNLSILETVRAYYLLLFREYVTEVLIPDGGFLPLPSGPGLGIELREEVLERADARIEISELRDQR